MNILDILGRVARAIRGINLDNLEGILSFTIPREGRVELLKAKLKEISEAGGKVRLFTNDYDPALDSEAADFTEAAFTGYSAHGIAGGPPVVLDNNESKATYPAEEWILGADEEVTIYGYFVTDSGKTKVFWADVAPIPIQLSLSGDKVRVTVEFKGGKLQIEP